MFGLVNGAPAYSVKIPNKWPDYAAGNMFIGIEGLTVKISSPLLGVFLKMYSMDDQSGRYYVAEPEDPEDQNNPAALGACRRAQRYIQEWINAQDEIEPNWARIDFSTWLESRLPADD